MGSFFATVLNHALAVAVGNYLGKSFNMHLVQMLAAASFIIFGLWTIRGDTLGGEDKKKMILGPIMTLAVAFFFAEMGDKTQLATVHPAPGERLAFTTDSYVVTPLVFPGGDIGKLAVCGTVNELAVSGARPMCLSAVLLLKKERPWSF